MHKNYRYYYTATFGWNPFAREDRRYLENIKQAQQVYAENPYAPHYYSDPAVLTQTNTSNNNLQPNLQINPVLSAPPISQTYASYPSYPSNTVIIKEQPINNKTQDESKKALISGGMVAGLGLTGLLAGTRKGQQTKLGVLGGATIGAGLGVASKYSEIQKQFERELNLAKTIPNKKEREEQIARIKKLYTEKLNLAELAMSGIKGGVIGGLAGGGLGLLL